MGRNAFLFPSMPRKRFDLRAETFSKVLGFSFQHWGRQPWRIAAIMAAISIATLTEVLTPLYAGRLVDAIAAGGQAAHDAAWSAFGVLVALGVAGVVFRQLCFRGLIVLTTRMMAGMANEAFHRVQRFSSDWHANSFAGSTVRRITRGIWALDLLNDTLLIAILPSVVMLVGATVLLGVHWPMMGVVVGVGSLLFIAASVLLSVGFVAPMASLANRWDTKLGGTLADSVGCNAVVKAFGAETREERRLAWIVAKWGERTRRSWNRGNVNGTVQGFLMVGMQVAILATTLLMWDRGEVGAGDVAFVLTMFFMLQGHLRDVGMHIRNLQRSVNDMEELVALQDQPLGIEDRQDAVPARITQGGIVFDHVTFRYGAHITPLFQDFTVAIRPGERVGLVGHSGSGKTTFIKLIQRLYDVSGGAVRIDGQDVRAVQQASLRAQIAIVQQEPILFHRTLSENIAYARPGATAREIEEAARQASAHEFIQRLPRGYDTLVGERGVKLSGGERQRIAIARAFLANAPILIFDEATSSLDSESEALIQAAMARLMVGRTTLVIAHRLSTVRALDRLLVFDTGRIVEEGAHDALLARPDGRYRRLYEQQALDISAGLAGGPAAAAD
ncbi:Transport ATP-binding protein CydCD [plant metagenome]|uniref:Transport ATP-binding protein CydCD n=1 Tax=plant metagenome TaxID=1297885 RepID=A0A484NRI5_9ZZZZ